MPSDVDNISRPPTRTGQLIITALLLSVIWTANVGWLQRFCPYYINEAKWRSDFLVNTVALVDTAKYYACARIGEVTPKQLWDQDTLQEWFKKNFEISQLSYSEITNTLSWAPYTPQSIVLFMPMTILPLHMAVVVTAISTLLLMIISVTILIKRYYNFGLSKLVFWWSLVLANAPIPISFYFGQIDGLLTALSAIFILTWQKKNCFWAALSLGLTLSIKPQRAGVLLIMALCDKKFALLFSTLGIYVIILLATVGVLGFDTVLAYPSKLAAIHRAIDSHKLPDAMGTAVGITSITSILFGMNTVDLITFPALVAYLLFSWTIWRKAVQAGNQSFPSAYACTVILEFICAPYQHITSLILLSVVWAYSVPAILVSDIRLIKEPPLRNWCFLFLLFPVISWAICFYNPGFGSISVRYLPLLLVMLAMSLANFRQSLKHTDTQS